MKNFLLYLITLFLLIGCGSTSTEEENGKNIKKAIIGTYLNNATIDNIKLSKDNKIAYLISYGDLIIVDVSNPKNPKFLSHNKISEYAIRDMVMSDDNKRVYLGIDHQVVILNVSNKKSPQKVVTYNNTAITLGMALSSDNSKLYLSTTQTGSGEQFFVLDIHDEKNIVELGRQVVTNYAHGVDIALSPDNSKAYIATEDWGLGVVDISDTQNLTLLTRKHIERHAYSVHLSYDGQQAYVVTGSDGFTILNVTDLNNFIVQGNYKSNSAFISKIIPSKDGTKLYTIDNKEGFQVFDITNPKKPRVLSKFFIQFPRGMSISKDEKKAYISTASYSEHNSSGGFVVLDLDYF